MTAERRLRLLMTADAVGGVWQYSLELAGALGPLGIDTVLAVMGPPPSEAQRTAAWAVPGLKLVELQEELDWLATEPVAVRSAGFRVADLAAAEGADIVQLNSAALASACRLPVPTVAVMHSCVASWWRAVRGTPLPADMAWRTALVAEGLGRVDTVVAPTAAYAAIVRTIYGVVALAVHNGRTPGVPRRRAMHDCAFTAGRLWDEAKNVRVLDEAAGRLGFPFVAAGADRGPNGEHIALRHLHALGQMSDARVADRLAARPVFASAALYEPFGLAVLEAAGAGCALVLSDIPTFRELWDEAALFVDPGDAGGFARAIEDLVGDPARRAAIGDLAQARAARYRTAAMAAEMAGIYHAMLSRPMPDRNAAGPAGKVAA